MCRWRIRDVCQVDQQSQGTMPKQRSRKEMEGRGLNEQRGNGWRRNASSSPSKKTALVPPSDLNVSVFCWSRRDVGHSAVFHSTPSFLFSHDLSDGEAERLKLILWIFQLIGPVQRSHPDLQPVAPPLWGLGGCGGD